MLRQATQANKLPKTSYWQLEFELQKIVIKPIKYRYADKIVRLVI